MINITLTNKEKTYEISDMDFITTVAIATDVYVQLVEEAQLESQVPDFAFSIRDSYPKFLNALEQAREELEADGKEVEENAFIRFWFEKLIFEEFNLHEKINKKGKPLKPFFKAKDYIL
ncbi:hypothetical protein [Bacillus paranthracis]|uniref:hypothetical protein n=1 Tax=Bacillus paranthracis TaxID=2026186 RepID=UPI002D76F1CA|nr:hypothetical protein [Bacillus paranthracis]